MINLRDKVIAVNDMRTMLGLPGAEATDETRILLIELSGYVQTKVREQHMRSRGS